MNNSEQAKCFVELQTNILYKCIVIQTKTALWENSTVSNYDFNDNSIIHYLYNGDIVIVLDILALHKY